MNVKPGDLVIYKFDENDTDPELGMYTGVVERKGNYLKIDWYNGYPEDFSFETQDSLERYRQYYLDWRKDNP